MADITGSTIPPQEALRPDGVTDTGAYRVGCTIDGQHVYAFYKAFSRPIDAQFQRIRLGMRCREERCCVCHAVFISGEMLTAIASSNHAVLFPTCFVHTTCIPGGAYATLVYWLHKEWRDAQRYACWF